MRANEQTNERTNEVALDAVFRVNDGAVRKQQLHNIEMAARRRHEQRRCFQRAGRRVDVGAGTQQSLDVAQRALEHSAMQRRQAVAVALVDIELARCAVCCCHVLLSLVELQRVYCARASRAPHAMV